MPKRIWEFWRLWPTSKSRSPVCLLLPLRTQSQLLRYLPPNTVIYGAVPNLGNTISQAMGFADQQAAENPAFGQWWNSSAGRSLKQLLAQVETVTHLFGNEIVYGYSQGVPGSSEKLPMIFAEVQPGKQADVTAALNALAGQMGASALPYQLTDTLLVLSDSATHLQLLLSNLGQGGATPFAQEIAARYQRGAGWLVGMDIESILSQAGAPGGTGSDFVGAHQTKHLFLERRDTQGAEENAMTVTFKGPRMGLASFLANSGSGGAAEYIPGDVIAAGYASTREPKQMFEEMLALTTRSDPSVSEPPRPGRIGVGSQSFQRSRRFHRDRIRHRRGKHINERARLGNGHAGQQSRDARHFHSQTRARMECGK